MASRGLGSLTLDLIAKIGGFVGPLTQAERAAQKSFKNIGAGSSKLSATISSSLKSAAGSFLAFAGVTASVAGAISGIKDAIDRADSIRDLSIRLGASTEAMSAFSYAAKQTGTDIDALSKGMLILSKNAALALDPKSKQSKLFDALGIRKEDLGDIETLVPKIADAFSQLADGTEKAALAQQLFGRNGAELIEFLNQGSTGLQEMGDKARDLGAIIDQDTANAADEFNDKLADLKTALGGAALEVAEALLPQLNELVDWAVTFVKEGGGAEETSKNLADGFRDLADVVGTVATAGSGIIGFLETVRGSMVEAEKQAGRSTLAIADFLAVTKSQQDFVSKRQAEFEARYKPKAGPVNNPYDDPIHFSKAPAGYNSEMQGRISRYLGGGGTKTGGGSKASGGKSDAEKEADNLTKAYESMNDRLKEQAALFGKDGEAAKIRYEIEHGELSKLDKVRAQELIANAERLDQMQEEADLLKKRKEIEQESWEKVNQALEDIASEAELLGKTREEQEQLTLARYLGAEAATAQGEAVAAALAKMQEERAQMEDTVDAMDGVRDSFRGLLEDVKDGNNIWDSMKKAVDNVADTLFDLAAKNIMNQIFGQAGSAPGGSTGGFFQQLFGAFFGGGRAGGGPVSAGRFYRINENGPELLSVQGRDYLMMGNQPGRVDSRAAGFTQNVTQVFHGKMTKQTARQAESGVGRAAQRQLARGTA